MDRINDILGRLAGLFLIAFGCVVVLAVPDQIDFFWLVALIACPICVCIGLIMLAGTVEEDAEED